MAAAKGNTYNQKFNRKLHPGYIAALMRLGLTDSQVAAELGIARETLHQWKGKPEVSHSIKNAKAEPDNRVERSLFVRACGYMEQVEKVHFMPDGTAVTHQTIRHHPPDTAACIFWLKNRRPDRWRERVAVQHSTAVVFQSPECLND